MRIDIGIDPDSSKHGCAIAINKQLVRLESMSLFEFVTYLQEAPAGAVIRLHVEDVSKMKAVFSDKARAVSKTARNQTKAQGEVARKVGMVQQSMNELIRFVESLGLDLEVRTYPISSAWKDSKTGAVWMERVWGYKGRSNEDTRSAAYFLSLGCR